MRVTYIFSLPKDADSQQREILDREGPQERPFKLETPALNEAKYLDQEKLAFVYDYLEKAEDARSMTTETSDSGMPGTQSASSELGMDEKSGKSNNTFLASFRLLALRATCLRTVVVLYFALFLCFF